MSILNPKRKIGVLLTAVLLILMIFLIFFKDQGNDWYKYYRIDPKNFTETDPRKLSYADEGEAEPSLAAIYSPDKKYYADIYSYYLNIDQIIKEKAQPEFNIDTAVIVARSSDNKIIIWEVYGPSTFLDKAQWSTNNILTVYGYDSDQKKPFIFKYDLIEKRFNSLYAQKKIMKEPYLTKVKMKEIKKGII